VVGVEEVTVQLDVLRAGDLDGGVGLLGEGQGRHLETCDKGSRRQGHERASERAEFAGGVDDLQQMWVRGLGPMGRDAGHAR